MSEAKKYLPCWPLISSAPPPPRKEKAEEESTESESSCERKGTEGREDKERERGRLIMCVLLLLVTRKAGRIGLFLF